VANQVGPKTRRWLFASACLMVFAIVRMVVQGLWFTIHDGTAAALVFIPGLASVPCAFRAIAVRE
jgi:hypothetical protein